MTRPAQARSRAAQARVAQVWLVLGLLLLLVFGLLGLQGWRAWQLTQRQLHSEAQAGATIAAAQIANVLQHLQDILLHTRLTFEQLGPKHLESDPLASARSGAQPPFRFIAVLDHGGRLLLRHPAAVRLPPLEGLGRAMAERGAAAQRLQVVELPDGGRTLMLAQRLNEASGPYAGVAVGALEPALLQTALAASLNQPLLQARVTLPDGNSIDGGGAAPSPRAQPLLQAPIDVDTGLQLQVLGDPQAVRDAWLQQMLWPTVAALGFAAVLVALGVALLRGLQREIASELRAQTAAAEVEVRSRFLAHMSHEIRTPMNGVLGAVELLAAQGNLSAEQLRLLEVVRRSGESLLTLLNDLLDASKIDAGRLTLTVGAFDLAQTLEDVVVLLAPLAQRKRLRLWHRLAPGLPQQVVGDALRVRQVLTNLLGNAIKFTEHGEVVLEAEPLPGGGVRLRVRDTGIGIAPEHLPRLFKPFAQLHAHTPNRFGGTGLGLSIAATLVEMMGGRLDVESEPGKGSTFTALLPLAPDDMAAERDPPQPLPGTPVLLLVHEASGAVALRDHLAWAGWTVHATGDLDDGLQRAAQLQQPGGLPPAWVVDSAAVDGAPEQALQRLRAHPRWPAAAPLVLLCDLQPPYPEGHGAVVLHQPARRLELAQALWRAWQQEQSHAQEKVTMTAAAAEPADPAPGNGTRLRVLAAEDSAVNRMILAEMLGHLGCHAELVEDGAQALQVLLSERWDLVLMDCAMPVMDGLEATRRWRAVERAEPGRGRLPIIALTAFAMPGDRQRCLDHGMDDHMSKPFTIAELKALLSRWGNGAPASGVPLAAPQGGHRPA